MILDCAGEGITGVDAEGIATFINPAAAAMLGYEVAEVLGNNVHELVHHSHADGTPYPLTACPIHAAAVTGTEMQGETEIFWRKDGTSFPVQFVARPIFDEGAISGAVVTFRDLTQHMQLEEQLRQSQKMEAIGSLAGGVAHDFNNLLFVIRTSASFLSDDVAPDPELLEEVEDISHAAERASSLVQQLLTFSRKQVGRPVVLRLSETVSELEKLLGRTIGEQIELTIRDSGDSWLTRIDPVHAEQIIVNLVVNARDAMPDGGHLSITTSNVVFDEVSPGHHPDLGPGRHVCVTVSDDGEGMPADVKQRIFEPFFSTKEERGTGLGLSTVYGIVREAGGSIEVDSTVGIGTTFRVYLPASTSEEEEAQASVPTEPSPQGEGKKVLVVEDDAAVSNLVERVLTRAGYKVAVAHGAGEAIETFGLYGDFDLVLTDIVMPGGSGLALADELLLGDEAVPVLFMSGYSDQLAGHDVEIPQERFLQKPFTREELLVKAAAALAGPLKVAPV